MHQGYLRFWLAATTLYSSFDGFTGEVSAAVNAAPAPLTAACDLQKSHPSALKTASGCGSRCLSAFGSGSLLAQASPPETSPSHRPRSSPNACMGTAGSAAGGTIGTAAAGPIGTGPGGPNPDAERAIQDACEALTATKRAEAGCPPRR